MGPASRIDFCHPIDLCLVYTPRVHAEAWWTRFVDERFAHVEVWRRLDEGLWIALQPLHYYLTATLVNEPPPGVVQNVTARRLLHKPLAPIGLKTCVTIAKAALGVRHAGIITPRQLYEYVERRHGIL